MKTVRLLLVEDQKQIKERVKIMLSKVDNIEIVREASSGIEAVDYIDKSSGNVDLIIMDINMPELNGVDATRIITGKYPNIKVLAFTYSSEKNIKAMINAGASGYILKSSEKAEIVEAIERVTFKNTHYTNEITTTLINTMISDDKRKETNLSEREIEVLHHIAQGSTSKEAGEKLFISNRTVESHRRNILSKLDIKSTAQMIAYALKNRLIV
jgi:DNA-binding NarL/FixJ family response regulator